MDPAIPLDIAGGLAIASSIKHVSLGRNKAVAQTAGMVDARSTVLI